MLVRVFALINALKHYVLGFNIKICPARKALNSLECFFLFSLKIIMGCSRKNPHLPDRWHAGNSHGRGGGRGVKGSRSPGRRGDLDLKTLVHGTLTTY